MYIEFAVLVLTPSGQLGDVRVKTRADGWYAEPGRSERIAESRIWERIQRMGCHVLGSEIMAVCHAHA